MTGDRSTSPSRPGGDDWPSGWAATLGDRVGRLLVDLSQPETEQLTALATRLLDSLERDGRVAQRWPLSPQVRSAHQASRRR